MEEWPTRIKDKFNLVKSTTRRALLILGEEYKFFEDLNIDLDIKFYIPLEFTHDNQTLTIPDKLNALYQEENKLPLSIAEEAKRRIKPNNRQAFLLPPKLITYLASILSPNFNSLLKVEQAELKQTTELI